MLIDGKKIAEVTVSAPGGRKVAVMSDDGVQKLPGYEVSVILDRRATPDAIVLKNDVLIYADKDNPKEEEPGDNIQRYLVTETDEKFFTMVPIVVDHEDGTVKLNFDKVRRYPNNRKIGTLADYNLYLDYRESLEEQEKEAGEKFEEIKKDNGRD